MSIIDRAYNTMYRCEQWYRGHVVDFDPDIVRVYAEALADAGLLMPDLPEPDLRHPDGELVWNTEGGTEVSTFGPLPINLAGPFGEGWSMHPIEARAIAHALLAAAEEADRDRA